MDPIPRTELPLTQDARLARRARARRRLRLRRLIATGVALLLAPVLYSYVSTMTQPSSLPLGVRSVEWLRVHHGNWLVDEVEQVYYSWKAPKKGGPQLKSLPAVGLAPAPATSAPTERPAQARARVAAWPARIKPVFAHPLPGEGVWKRTGPLVDGRPPVLVTTFRSERDYPRIVAYLAWFDHTRTALAFYPGRYEPPSAPVRGPMSVPYSQRWRLLATFNSGFTYIDGHNGSSINGRTYEPLKDGLATLIGYRDGRVDVKTWSGGPNAGPQVAFARQSLPLIVQDGRLNPALNDSSQWGFTLGNAVRVWRTGVGIDRRGNLIYAAADDQRVITLARILQRVGAVRAMQFDINAEWPSLISYSHHGGLGPTKVVPNVMQPATRYLAPTTATSSPSTDACPARSPYRSNSVSLRFGGEVATSTELPEAAGCRHPGRPAPAPKTNAATSTQPPSTSRSASNRVKDGVRTLIRRSDLDAYLAVGRSERRSR